MLGLFTKNAWLNRYKNTGTTADSTIWISIHDADPLDTGADEVTPDFASGRAAYNSANFTNPTGTIARSISTTSNITFGSAIASGSAPFFGAWTSETGGSFIAGLTVRTDLGLANPLTFASGESIDIDAGTLTISIPTGNFSIYEVDNILNFIKGTNLAGLANLYARLVTPIGEITMGSRLAIASSIWDDIEVISNISQIKNSLKINFADATESLLGLTGIGFWDASTTGNKIFETLRSPFDIVSGQKLFVSANKLKVRVG